MSYTPSATPSSTPSLTPPPSKPKDNRQLIYGLLIAALAITWGWIIYDKGKTKETQIEYRQQIATVTTARDSIQAQFNDASAKMDSLTGSNVQLQGALAQKNSDILKIKSNISNILKKKNATDEELKEAKGMIAELNGKIDGYVAEINKLKGENEQLTTANTQLSSDKKNLQDTLSTAQGQNRDLSEKVDLANTLHASNINVTAIQVKKNGKEKETTVAKNADLLTISCSLDENRVTPTGQKTLYVCVYNPDGSASGSSGTFKTRDGNDRSYTDKVLVNYEQGKSLPVSFNWKPGGKFVTGDYKIEIYNNGFKIGEGRKSLKKGGFLGL